jgi:hypothetical protein
MELVSCRVVKERCIGKQDLFYRLSENISLVSYQDMKRKEGREEYIDCCNRNKRRGVVW